MDIRIPVRLLAVALAVSATLWPNPALAANCSGVSTGLVAIPDLGAATYEGERGGLYPGGSNEPPAAYARAGARAASAIAPRDAQGRPDPNGRVVLLSVGMSNTTIEFSAFVRLAQADGQRDGHVVVVDGAQGGQDASRWVGPNAPTWAQVEQRLQRAGVTDAQVQAIWLKQAQASPRSDFETYIHSLAVELRQIVDVAAKRYPNLQQVFVSPRTYAGYSTTQLNPEPYAYQTGFADKLLVAESVAHADARPWIGWGPYLWTDGAKGRSDGFVWTCGDVRDNDGTHPSVPQGQMKVANELRKFFDTSTFASWYRGTPSPAAQQDTPESEPSDDEGTPNWQLPVAIVAGIGGIGAGGFIVRRLMRR